MVVQERSFVRSAVLGFLTLSLLRNSRILITKQRTVEERSWPGQWQGQPGQLQSHNAHL